MFKILNAFFKKLMSSPLLLLLLPPPNQRIRGDPRSLGGAPKKQHLLLTLMQMEVVRVMTENHYRVVIKEWSPYIQI